jgi:NAD(P)-dependent dehydrogenase (short-subunit alcohol dehydrogenase family)
VLPLLRASRGRIVILSSQMGSTQRAPGGSYAYRASKAAVLNLGRNLATDLAPEGIAVSILHPGWVQTDMGGSGAEITPEAAAEGILDRLDALDVATTGRFETWDGRAHPF